MERRTVLDPSHQQAAPMATATIGSILAFGPHLIDSFYRGIGLLAVVAGMAVSVWRFSWDYQDRRQILEERRAFAAERREKRLRELSDPKPG